MNLCLISRVCSTGKHAGKIAVAMHLIEKCINSMHFLKTNTSSFLEFSHPLVEKKAGKMTFLSEVPRRKVL